MPPCPFCGGEPVFVPDDSYGSARVICPDDNNCPADACSWANINAGEPPENAIAAWNTRVPDPEAAKLIAELRSEIAGLLPFLEAHHHSTKRLQELLTLTRRA